MPDVSLRARRSGPQAGGVGISDAAPRLRILILEHCYLCTETLSTLVRLLGHEVRTARNGNEAIEVGDEFRPELVLLHTSLPGQDGYEVARRIPDRAWGKGVVLIALTGAGAQIDERQFQEAGFDHHLPKPIDVEALVVLIGQPLSPRR
jgi:CheY-like chemotaxis protein